MTITRRSLRRIRRSAFSLEACEARILMATAPSLGVASTFAILAGTTVTNTGGTNIVGDVGVSPGSAITGFPPGTISGGAIHADDATATQAEADTATAYTTLAGETVDTSLSGQGLGGLTLTPGVYNFAAAASLNGTLTLDGQGDPNAVFVIQIGTTFTAGNGSVVTLIGGAHARNVFWQVGSTATLGTNSAIQGNLLAFTSITFNTGASVSPGRALAINGAVTLDTNEASSVFTTPLTITANNQSTVYGSALQPFTFSYNGFINGDTAASLTTPPTGLTTAASARHVAGGPYAITGSGAVDPDYTFNYVSGSLTVTPAPLTITANDQSKEYGAPLPTLTASYTGLVNGDTALSLPTPPSLDTTATATSSVAGSPYAISASGAVDPDYTISYVSGSLGVTAAPLTITADPQTKVYGAALPALTASYSGFVNGDTVASLTALPSLASTADASSHVGTYAVTASGAVDPNYTISYVSGSLGVTAAPLTITADPQTKVYGAALPALTASYSGFVNGDTAASLTTAPVLATTATATSSVAGSPYAISASGAVDPDYTISYVSGSLGVTAAPLTITADPQTKVYGAALPALTASYSGFVNGDTAASLTTAPVLATTATATSSVAGSPYAISASGAVDPDYTISYVSGSLGVTAAPLTITADPQTKVYGAALPVLTASYSGFVNGDTAASLTALPSLASTANASSHVGTYAVTASGAVDPNYTISYVSGSLGVTAAPLTITADPQTKVYGAALPVLTASYSGFVNGDTVASLTALPSLASTANASSHVGTYAVTASGAVDPDYAISYVSGALAVVPASLIITANNQTSSQGAPLPPLTASYTGFVTGDNAASLTTPPTLATTATSTSPVGTYAITASGALDPDYSISYVAGSLALTTSVPPTTVSGNVYLDLNASGAPDAGEPGLAGRVVFLDLNGDGHLTAGEPSATTDSGGNFTLTSTTTGTGRVVEATDLDTMDRNVVDQTVTKADGMVTIGVVPISSIAPVSVVPNPFSANPSPDASTAYVQSLYHAVLGRSGADSEVGGWLAIIAKGATRSQVAEGFVNSPEHRLAQVETYYGEFLGRGIDPYATVWVNQLLAGKSEESVVEGILGSPEYQAAHQDSLLFLQDLYTEVLGRRGEASGLQYWLSEMASGVSREAIVAGFVTSPEANGQIVVSDYAAFLRRPREQGTTSDIWMNRLDAPGSSATEVATDILASPEFNRDATTPKT